MMILCLLKLIVGVFADPLLEFRDSGIDSGPVSIAASNAPADDAGKFVSVVKSFQFSILVLSIRIHTFHFDP